MLRNGVLDKDRVFRPDMIGRKPDFVDESFRQYAINWGVVRVGRIFNEQEIPLTIGLNALFPQKHPESGKHFVLWLQKLR